MDPDQSVVGVVVKPCGVCGGRSIGGRKCSRCWSIAGYFDWTENRKC